MGKITKKLFVSLFIGGMITIAGIFTSTSIANAAQSTVNLGTATPFAILAGTPNITDAGNASVIHGNVGLSPASGTGLGLLCSQVTGVIYSVDAAGPLPCRVTNGPLLVGAKNDLTTAYTDASGRTPITTVPAELGGTTKVGGVYASASTQFGITAGAGALVLDGQNDPSSVFIFEAAFNGTGLNVGSGSTISLINGAQACNVFWRVNTASLDTTANFKGTILASNSITVNNGATIEGRLLAENGDVTLNTDTITVPTCAATTGGSTTGSTSVPGLPNTGSGEGAGALLPLATSIFCASALVISLVFAFRKRHANSNVG